MELNETDLTNIRIIDFHPTEPWILTTLYSGMLRERELRGTSEVLDGLISRQQVMSTFGRTNHR
jgi:hypothetical protein